MLMLMLLPPRHLPQLDYWDDSEECLRGNIPDRTNLTRSSLVRLPYSISKLFGGME